MALESYDDTALGETPPRRAGKALGAAAPALPRATGTPALAQRADGTANLGATTVTKQAATAQPSSGVRATRAAVQTYTDDEV